MYPCDPIEDFVKDFPTQDAGIDHDDPWESLGFSLTWQAVHKSEKTVAGVTGHKSETHPLLTSEVQETLNKHGSTCYNQAVKISGNVIQVRDYEKTQVSDYDRPEQKKKALRQLSPAEQLENQKKCGLRAKAKLVDLINSNFGLFLRGFVPGKKSVKFLTLTYKSNMQSREQAHTDFVKFIDALEYRLGEKVEYITVLERQERGAWHFHIVVYCSFIPLKDLWSIWNAENGKGSFKVEQVKHVRNLGRYVSKYLSKTFDEATGQLDAETFGKRRFWTSRGLKDKTVKVKVQQEKTRMTFQGFKEWFAWGKGLVLSSREGEYTGEYTGKVNFLEFILKPCEETKVLIDALQKELCVSSA